MKLYEAECEVNGWRIVYKTVIAKDEKEATDMVMDLLTNEEVRVDDLEPPCILSLVCMKEDV